MPDESPWKDLKNQIIDSVRAHAQNLLDDEPEVRALLAERAERLAQIMFSYTIEINPDAREKMLLDAEFVKSTMENTLSTMALKASAEARATFMGIISAVFNTAIKVIPSVA